MKLTRKALVLRMARQLWPELRCVVFSTELRDWVWNKGEPIGASVAVVIHMDTGNVSGSLEAAGRRLCEEHTRRAIDQGHVISDDVLRWHARGGPPVESSDERERGYVPDFARRKT